MPRRMMNQCQRRGARAELEETVEADLTLGHCFGVAAWEMKTIREIADAWRQWGEEISRRWADEYPGSRPMAAYILGRIPPCRWEHRLPALRHPLRRIEGCRVEIPDTGWHTGPQELEHLLDLGLVDDEEHRAALDRLAGRRRPHRPAAAAST